MRGHTLLVVVALLVAAVGASSSTRAIDDPCFDFPDASSCASTRLTLPAIAYEGSSSAPALQVNTLCIAQDVPVLPDPDTLEGFDEPADVVEVYRVIAHILGPSSGEGGSVPPVVFELESWQLNGTAPEQVIDPKPDPLFPVSDVERLLAFGSVKPGFLTLDYMGGGTEPVFSATSKRQIDIPGDCTDYVWPFATTSLAFKPPNPAVAAGWDFQAFGEPNPGQTPQGVRIDVTATFSEGTCPGFTDNLRFSFFADGTGEYFQPSTGDRGSGLYYDPIADDDPFLEYVSQFLNDGVIAANPALPPADEWILFYFQNLAEPEAYLGAVSPDGESVVARSAWKACTWNMKTLSSPHKVWIDVSDKVSKN